MWIVESENRGVEYASESKQKCKDALVKLKADDEEHNVEDCYEIYECDGYWEGWQ